MGLADVRAIRDAQINLPLTDNAEESIEQVCAPLRQQTREEILSSAGANPGPACYRRGGPLTVTDCNVLLGKVQADYFPKVFGENANQPLDAENVREKFSELAKQISSNTGSQLEVEQVAEGFLRIAIENMANAIKKISVQRGYDVTEYTLNCFGGAGGQHACMVADALGMEQIFLHPLAGVLSASSARVSFSLSMPFSTNRKLSINTPSSLIF